MFRSLRNKLEKRLGLHVARRAQRIEQQPAIGAVGDGFRALSLEAFEAFEVFAARSQLP